MSNRCTISDSIMVEYKDGAKSWVNARYKLHRSGDLPAIIETNGTLEWWVNGLRHRDDGNPAVIVKPTSVRHGYRSWFINGEQHRIDGPAFEYDDGSVGGPNSWFLYGVHYELDEWLELTPISEEQKLLIKLRYG